MQVSMTECFKGCSICSWPQELGCLPQLPPQTQVPSTSAARSQEPALTDGHMRMRNSSVTMDSVSQVTGQLPLIKVKPLPCPALNHKESTVSKSGCQRVERGPWGSPDLHRGSEGPKLFSQ